MAKVVFIASTGHSGSTLLDIALGHYGKMISTGEVVYLPWQIFRNNSGRADQRNGEVCTCGKPFADCDFWRHVIDKLSERTGYSVIDNPLKFRLAILSKQTYPPTDVAIRIYRNLLFRSLPYADRINRQLFKSISKAQHNNGLLFETLDEITGQPVIDSTKDILRIKYLSELKNIEARVLVLIRSAMGVSASAKRRGQDPVLVAGKWLKYYRQLRDMLTYQHIKYNVVQYEYFTGDFDHCMNDILGFMGEGNNELRVSCTFTSKHHLVAGNGVRYNNQFTVRRDDKWKEILTSREMQIIEEINEKNPFLEKQ